MKNRSPFELKYQQLKKFESLKVTEKEIIEIEQCIRYKSKDPKWHKVRLKRITASSAGEIAKKKSDISHSYLIITITISLNHLHMWNTKIRFIELLLK